MKSAVEKALSNGRRKHLAKPPEKQLIKLNIAAGQSKIDGFRGIDIIAGDGVDYVHDLTKYPWPIEDESVSEGFCSHYIEHVPMLCMCCAGQVDPLFRFFDELYRILIPGGKVRIIAPYYASVRCWQDPTHRRAISEFTFMYANADWRKNNRLDHYSVSCDFDFGYAYSLTAEWANRSQEARDFAIRHYKDVIQDIDVTMTKKVAT